MQKIRIKIKGFDNKLVDTAVKQIMEDVIKSGANVAGPIPLPNKRRLFTVLQSPHIDVTAKEHFELVTHIRQPYYIHEHIIKIGVSIGVAVYPDDGESIVELLRHADLAMYEAKRNGKNRWARAKRLPSQQKNTLDPHS
jgi:ribosomal protein S10